VSQAGRGGGAERPLRHTNVFRTDLCSTRYCCWQWQWYRKGWTRCRLICHRTPFTGYRFHKHLHSFLQSDATALVVKTSLDMKLLKPNFYPKYNMQFVKLTFHKSDRVCVFQNPFNLVFLPSPPPPSPSLISHHLPFFFYIFLQGISVCAIRLPFFRSLLLPSSVFFLSFLEAIFLYIFQLPG